MAISKIGTTSVDTSGGGDSGNTQPGSVSASITIPTGARVAVVGFNGWASTQLSFGTLAQVTLNGNESTYSLTTTRGTSDGLQGAAYLIPLSASDEGSSKTLAWNNNQAIYDGGGVIVRFLAGVDTTGVRDSYQLVQDGDPVSFSTGSMTCQSGDLAIGLAESDTDPSWTSGTNVFSHDLGLSYGSFGETDCTGSTVTLAYDGSWGSLVALVLKPAATGTTITGNDLDLALDADTGVVSRSTVVAGQDLDLALEADKGLVGRATDVTGSTTDLALEADTGVLTHATNIVGVELQLALEVDRGSLGAGTVIVGNPLVLALEADRGTISSDRAVIGNDLDLALAADTGTVSSDRAITGAALDFALVADAGTIRLNPNVVGTDTDLALEADQGLIGVTMVVAGVGLDLTIECDVGAIIGTRSVPGNDLDLALAADVGSISFVFTAWSGERAADADWDSEATESMAWVGEAAASSVWTKD
jgi:hypothetical protein